MRDELDLEAAFIDEQITTCEKRYNMSSDEFAQKWDNGELPDTFEFNAWRILIDALNNLWDRQLERDANDPDSALRKMMKND